MKTFDFFAVAGFVALLGIGAMTFLRGDPTQEEVNGLKAVMPALVKEDFLRLAQDAGHADGVPWRQAFVLKTEAPFEDWYGMRGKHSLKINVVARRQDGALFSATYRVALDDRACTKEPKKCATLDGLSAFTRSET